MKFRLTQRSDATTKRSLVQLQNAMPASPIAISKFISRIALTGEGRLSTIAQEVSFCPKALQLGGFQQSRAGEGAGAFAVPKCDYTLTPPQLPDQYTASLTAPQSGSVRRLPTFAPLFPRRSKISSAARAARFNNQCKSLGISWREPSLLPLRVGRARKGEGVILSGMHRKLCGITAPPFIGPTPRRHALNCRRWRTTNGSTGKSCCSPRRLMRRRRNHPWLGEQKVVRPRPELYAGAHAPVAVAEQM